MSSACGAESQIIKVFPVRVEAYLCADCHKLISDLSAIPFARIHETHGWRRLPTKPPWPATYRLIKHQNGTLVSLRHSAQSGCQMCNMMSTATQKVATEQNGNLSERYTISVMNGQARCEFDLTIEDAQSFRKSYFKVPHLRFPLCRRNGHEKNWGLFDSFRGQEQWPTLLPSINSNPGSEEAFRLAKSWLSTCMSNHQLCIRSRRSLPKRILDLEPLARGSEIKLRESLCQEAEYATLSYSWGQALPFRTTTINIEDHYRGIPIDRLPRTLKEAVMIAYRLDFRYLWIDALCINQDDHRDWVDHASQMTEIYSQAALNISAMACPDCESGILNELPICDTWLGSCIMEADPECAIDVFVEHDAHDLDLSETHLSSRGWAFQERLVSPASLHYTNKGMAWECRTTMFREASGSFGVYNMKASWRGQREANSGHDRRHEIDSASTDNQNQPPYSHWYSWVEAYSPRNLTKSDDRLPALAGIASGFADQYQLQYAAGLWREDFRVGLLWSRSHLEPSLTVTEAYVAPSWSWASVFGRINYKWPLKLYPVAHRYDLSIIEIDVTAPDGRFQKPTAAKIRAQGLLQKVTTDMTRRRNKGSHLHKCRVTRGLKCGYTMKCVLDTMNKRQSRVYHCWSLQVGSCDADGRDAIYFLLLDRIEGTAGVPRFRRVGTASVLLRGLSRPGRLPLSVFKSGEWVELLLV